MSRNTASSLKYQRGTAAVEMAIGVPLLVLLLLVSAEFGRLFNHYNELEKSVRTGVRYLSENSLSTSGSIQITGENQERTRNLIIYSYIDDDDGTHKKFIDYIDPDDITITSTNIDGDDYVNVTVTVDYVTLFGTVIPKLDFGSGIDLSNITLTSSISMRALH